MTKKLDALQQKKQQIEAQIRELKARERTKQRKLETRKKIILGGALLAAEQKYGRETTIEEIYDYAEKSIKKEPDLHLILKKD